MDLGKKVKQRRVELNLSQEDLAFKMGYSSRTSINKIENGRPCSQKIIARLAEALDVSVPYLMGWEEDNPEVPDFDPEQIELIELYSKLTREQRNVVLKFLHTLVDG